VNGRAMELTMADPMGTAGAVKENILDVATAGGPRFMDRLRQLGDATDKHDQAFEKLGIGQSAVAAFNQSQQKLAEAETKLAEADAMRSQAAKTLANADADAKASAKAQAVASDKAIALQIQVEKRLELAVARERAAAEAIAKAERARAEAERTREVLQGKTDKLLREIAAVTH
jgi:hypothetical protein